MGKPVNQNYKLSKKFNAPLDFVFQWCTDFREDDPKIIGSKTVRKILEKDSQRVIWRVRYKDGRGFAEGLRFVTLQPPNAWHLDSCGDTHEVGDYKLISLGKNKTRLEMKFTVTYDGKKDVEDKDEWEKDGDDHWVLYKKALERDYQRASRANQAPQPSRGPKAPEIRDVAVAA